MLFSDVTNGHDDNAPVTEADSCIRIQGAREHNLKNITVEIPRGQFVVVTGVSGSGKSTLAFDIVFAEGQRRFLDSMSAYARQFVEQMARPEVDLITGLPPTVSIEQRVSRGGGKSTVATVTEVYHFLRLLFARLGTQYCPTCQVPVAAQTRDQLGARLIAETKKRGDLLLLAPVVRNRKGFHTEVAEWAARHGYKEIRADGKIYQTSQPFRLERFREHDVEVVIGVLEADKARRDKAEKPPQALIDEALQVGHGALLALANDRQATVHSTARACGECGESFPPLDPKMFSYNSAQGWCPKCRGFGELFYLPDVDRGAREDVVAESWFSWQEGKREPCPDCEGARLNPIARNVRLVTSAAQKSPPTIDTFARASTTDAIEKIAQLKFAGHQAEIARDILPEIRERLKFLAEVGLDYLQLGRSVTTLSGGEAQRIRLAAQLGSNLSGVLYVLDEPTIGLHPRDNEHLLRALQLLKHRGNTLLVVEHDEETMRRADYIIDLGPGAGVKGGEVIATGTFQEICDNPNSPTGQQLASNPPRPARGARRPAEPFSAAAEAKRLKLLPGLKRALAKAAEKKAKPEKSGPVAPLSLPAAPFLTLHNARANNLKNLTIHFPLGRFIAITGVSGSGKSTLIRECLLPAVQAAIARKPKGSKVAKVDAAATYVSGHESLKVVHEVDQSPIGRTPRSTPATYVGFFDDIRQLFSQAPEARLRGYTPSRFSFNSVQGRCPTCEGAGSIKLEMNFLPPANVACESCQGARFNRETLDIEWRGKSIADVMNLSVAEGLEYFAAIPKVRRPLEALRDTGLDYLKLGQISPTLSGGEAQRIKLVTHLLSGLKEQTELFRPGKQNLFILEEPTIGLHISDVRRLVEVLQRLVDAGHTVVVIEHNLDLIAEADWVIDLGPEAGEGGGTLVAEGTPEIIAQSRGSHTAKFLKPVLKQAASR
jgi:excinuclease ABC subunit A